MERQPCGERWGDAGGQPLPGCGVGVIEAMERASRFPGEGGLAGVEVWRSQKENQWDGSPPLNAGSGPRKGRDIGGCGPR